MSGASTAGGLHGLSLHQATVRPLSVAPRTCAPGTRSRPSGYGASRWPRWARPGPQPWSGFAEVEIFSQQIWDAPADQTAATICERYAALPSPAAPGRRNRAGAAELTG